jgi:hypothetical protein
MLLVIQCFTLGFLYGWGINEYPGIGDAALIYTSGISSAAAALFAFREP